MEGNRISDAIFDSHDTYSIWRDKKLANATTCLDNACVEISNPAYLSTGQKQQIANHINANNFVLYQFNLQKYEAKSAVLAINQQLGLVDYDKHLYANTSGLAYISPSEVAGQDEFIPYTNKALNWHTDGYYNSINQRVRSFNLFCVQPAKAGGKNAWIDHEIIYILLREKSPELAELLTQNDIMTVPAHQVDGVIRRKKSVGAVFLIDALSGALMMRYTQRKQNIIWKPSPKITQAKQLLDEILASQTPYHFTHQMSVGQGLVCHNITHKRHAFSDTTKQQRLMIRGRYFNRISVLDSI